MKPGLVEWTTFSVTRGCFDARGTTSKRNVHLMSRLSLPLFIAIVSGTNFRKEFEVFAGGGAPGQQSAELATLSWDFSIEVA